MYYGKKFTHHINNVRTNVEKLYKSNNFSPSEVNVKVIDADLSLSKELHWNALFPGDIEQIRYDINRSKRTITCIIATNNPISADGAVRKFVGVATCDITDEWDDDKGKQIALTKALILLHKRFKLVFNCGLEAASYNIQVLSKLHDMSTAKLLNLEDRLENLRK